ncbi:MAG: hypothetical protein ACXITV_03190 [Luteibaculaceae bacterium]
MRNAFKWIALTIGCVVFSVDAQAQVSVTTYGTNAVGINTNTGSKFDFELKTFANRSFENLVFEPTGFFNFSEKENHSFGVGLGLILDVGDSDFLTALSIPVNLQVHPMKDFRQLSLILELAPVFNADDLALRHLWGVRYTFGSTKQ